MVSTGKVALPSNQRLPTMFKRLSHLFSDFAGLFAGEKERETPMARLEAEKESLRGQIAKYHLALVSHSGHCEWLMTKVKEFVKKEHDLREKTAGHLREGNRDAAGACAVQLQAVQRDLEEHRRRLEEAERSYRELLQARDVVVKAAQAKVEALRLGLDDLKVKQTVAELTETAAAVVEQIGAGGTLERLAQMVNEERYRAMGRARVAQDLIGNADLAFKEYEPKALAEQALRDFAAQEGLSFEGEKSDGKL